MAVAGAIRAGGAVVELFADRTRLERDLRGAQQLVGRFARTTMNVGRTLAGVGAAAALPIGHALKTYAGFGDQMAELRAVAGLTGTQFQTLNDQAKRLGRTTSFTAAQVAGAQTELGRAGFDSTGIEQATSAVLSLARATRTELPQSAQIAADTLRGFKLTAEQMPRVADVLAATANNSSQNIVDLFEALKLIGPIATDAGESLEQAAAAVGIPANNGIKGSLAGTALRKAYLSLADPAIQKKLHKLTGVTAVDAAGNLRPLATVIAEIGQSIKRLPNAQRISVFEQLFGDRAVVAASNLATANADFKDLLATIRNSSGAAARAATVMDDTLGGSFRQLMSAAEGVQIAVGETLGGTARSVLRALTAAAGGITSFIENNRQLVVTLSKSVVGVTAIGAGLLGAGLAARAATAAFGGLAFVPKLLRTMARAATTLSGLRLAGGLLQLPRVLGAFRPFPGILRAATSGTAAFVSGLQLIERATRTVAGVFTSVALPAIRGVAGMTASVFAGLGQQAGVAGQAVGRTFNSLIRVADRTATAFRLNLAIAGLPAALRGLAGWDGLAAAAAARSLALKAAAMQLGSTLAGVVVSGLTAVRTAARTSFAALVAGSRAAFAAAVSGATAAVGSVGRLMTGVGTLAGVVRRITLARVLSAASSAAVSSLMAIRSVTITTVSLGKTALLAGGRLAKLGAVGAAALAKLSAAGVVHSFAGLKTVAVSVLPKLATGLAALVSPATLSLGAVVGLGAALVHAAGGFDNLVQGGQALGHIVGQSLGAVGRDAAMAFGRIRDIGTRSFGEIVNRVKSGDLAGAFRLATKSVSAMWSETAAALVGHWIPIKVAIGRVWSDTAALLRDTWATFVDFFGPTVASLSGLWTRVMTSLGVTSGDTGRDVQVTWNDVTASLAEMFTRAWFAVEETFLEVSDFIADAWDTVVSSIMSTWRSATQQMQKAWVRVKGLFDDSIDVDYELNRIDAEAARDDAARTLEHDRRIVEREQRRRQRLAEIDQQRSGTLVGIDAERERRNTEDQSRIETETSAAQTAANQAAQQAQAELDAELAGPVPVEVELLADVQSADDALASITDRRQIIQTELGGREARRRTRLKELRGAVIRARGHDDVDTKTGLRLDEIRGEQRGLLADRVAVSTAAGDELAALDESEHNVLADRAAALEKLNREMLRLTREAEGLELVVEQSSGTDRDKVAADLAELKERIGAIRAVSSNPHDAPAAPAHTTTRLRQTHPFEMQTIEAGLERATTIRDRVQATQDIDRHAVSDPHSKDVARHTQQIAATQRDMVGVMRDVRDAVEEQSIDFIR